MSKLSAWFGRERNRAYVYRVVVAAGAVAASYGVVSGADVALWSGLVATAFLLPAANTSTAKPDERGAGELVSILIIAAGVVLGLVVYYALQRAF